LRLAEHTAVDVRGEITGKIRSLHPSLSEDCCPQHHKLIRDQVEVMKAGQVGVYVCMRVCVCVWDGEV